MWSFSNEDYDDDRADETTFLNARAKINNVNRNEEVEFSNDDMSPITLNEITNSEISVNQLAGLEKYEEWFGSLEDQEKQAHYQNNLIQKKHEVDTDWGMTVWSKGITDSCVSHYVPEHCSNVATTKIFGELNFTGFAAENYQFEPDHFKSHDNYMQGLKLPYKYIPEGDTRNMFFVLMKFEYVHNYFPIPIMITLKQRGPDGNDTALHNALINHNGQQFHCLVPPGEHKDLTIYASNKSVNDEFGRRFPNFTYDTVEDGIQADHDGKAFPKRHPCIWYYHREMYNMGWEPPSLNQEKQTFTITSSIAANIIQAVKDIIKKKIQTIDISKTWMEVKPMADLDISDKLIKYDALEKVTVVVNIDEDQGKTVSNIEPKEKPTGVLFSILSHHIFREHREEVASNEEKENVIQQLATQALNDY